MERNRQRAVLITLTALVWATALGVSTFRFKLAAKAPLTVSLRTTPRAVRIALNGEPKFDGSYVETPVELALPPGKSRLKIARAGYIAHVITIEGEAGESFKMGDVVLQRSPTAAFASLEVTVAGGDEAVRVEVDDGLVRGETPVAVDDLTEGAHVLTAFPRWPELQGKVRCRFVVAGGEAVRIRVGRQKGGRLKMVGCERLGR